MIRHGKANPVKFTVPDAWKTTANQWGNLWGGIIAAPTCAEMLIDNAILEYGGAVTTESSPSVKAGLYKATAGQHVPAVNYSNVNGKLVIVNSRMNNQNEDGFYMEGGKVIDCQQQIYTQGVSGGDAINIKSGVEADVAFNFVYSPNTNALKLSNTGDPHPAGVYYRLQQHDCKRGLASDRPLKAGRSGWSSRCGPRFTTICWPTISFGVKRDRETARKMPAAVR